MSVSSCFTPVAESRSNNFNLKAKPTQDAKKVAKTPTLVQTKRGSTWSLTLLRHYSGIPVYVALLHDAKYWEKDEGVH